MTSVAFITGLNGQDGSYLAEWLLSKEYKVYGIIRRMSSLHTERIDALRSENFQYFYGDMTDSAGLFQVMNGIIQKHPDAQRFEVYHLAAQSHVKISFELPEYTAQVDAIGTLKLLEVCRTLRDIYGWAAAGAAATADRLRIYVACTSEMFGGVSNTPLNEASPFEPRSPYAAAKLYAYYISKNYREAYGMFIASGILFNHESPRRGANFATRKITLGLGEILRGERSYISMGNLDAVRDWGHARDYVRAMWLMLQVAVPEDYVIATGKTHTVREFIEYAFALRGMPLRWTGVRGSPDEVGMDSHGHPRVRVDAKYYRPTECAFLCGDATKARQNLHWSPEISFEDLVKEMVEADAPAPASSVL
jgi:GDPmannose 4,6-dehydratase